MPKKYHIHAKLTPARFTPVGKFGIIDCNESCAGACKNCVKKKCIYEIYKKDAAFMQEMQGDLHLMYGCMNCMSCVQNCTRAVVTRTVNPEFKWLGNNYWQADMISRLWWQAETGSVPVSGAGYRGPFSGPGFDSMWTDMSEIVRPTRDGIHGREYISTSVDIGAKLGILAFNSKGGLAVTAPPMVEIPVAFIMNKPPFGAYSPKMFEAFANAAHEMGTLLLLEPKDITPNLKPYMDVIAPVLKGPQVAANRKLIAGAKLVEIIYDNSALAAVKAVKKIKPGVIVSVKADLDANSPALAEKLTAAGVEVIHFCADINGDVKGGKKPKFIKDAFKRIHLRLVDKGTRDKVTLIADGGVALAEHMAKVIICGADLVALSIPYLIAMECRMCMNCEKGLSCPVEIDNVPLDYGTQRILNLSNAWRNQLLEVLGAMGLREVRRLRGEFGRAMFYEDLEKETFKKIFSGKKALSR